jgi:AcrR family transcriptional regulator
MPSPLEKARQDPDSMKARILASARKLFGEYGYSRTTTRMIAGDVGIDISTLYYHWGEKLDLYEALITDLNDEILAKLEEVEQHARGKPLSQRLDISIDILADYLFIHPEVSNLILFGYFNKADTDSVPDIKIGDYTSGIAVAMDLAQDKAHVPVQAKASILAVWNCVLNFISGENFFRPILNVDHADYQNVVKETVKRMMVSTFTK